VLDLRRIQDNPDELEEMLRRRRFRGVDSVSLKSQIEDSKELKSKIDTARSNRNSASKEIGALMSQGKKDEAEKRKSEVKKIGEEISTLGNKYQISQNCLEEILTGLPNFLENDVPDGDDENQNVFMHESGKKPDFSFKPLTHYELGEKMGIFDFERGVKLAGSRFYTYRGLAARLERALINFMLELHTTEFGYEEVWVPSLVDDRAMMVTGQYPKFRGEFYDLEKDGLALIPTSEVPLVNLYRDEIIPEEELPVKLTAATSCFRREAGAAGKDTRGLIRVHQFQKVELVQIVIPEKSREVQLQMLANAEEVLKRLGLHYRVMLLCSGDTGAAAARTFDIEVWMPGLNRYLEISSISNCLEYQARRGAIRYRAAGPKKKPILVNTLNGSALAIGRTMIAIMENYQKKEGGFDIPDVLKNRISLI